MIFEGYARKPVEKEVVLLLSLMSYLKNKFGIKYSEYEDDSGTPVSRKTVSNAVAGRTMQLASFKELTKRVYERVVSENRFGERHILRDFDSFMLPALTELYPFLESEGLLPDQVVQKDMAYSSLYGEYSSKDSATLRLFLEKFGSGGYIYRYARNKNPQNARNPRIAKGRIDVSDIGSSSCVGFSIRHHVDSDAELSEPYDNFIDGKVYLLKSIFLFTGIERERHNPFVMVMKSGLQGMRFKAMILRKHPARSYFASRAMVSCEVDAAMEATGKFPALEQTEVTSRQLSLIRNFVENKGESVLMLED